MVGQIETQVTKSVGGYLLDRLCTCGVRHLFRATGHGMTHSEPEWESNQAIQWIYTAQENAAGYMANLCARMCGLGAAYVRYGDGILMAKAIAQAHAESSPVVLMSERLVASDPSKKHNYSDIEEGRELHHKNTQFEIFKRLTVDQAIVQDSNSASETIEQLLESCLFHKKPVYLEIAYGVAQQPIQITEQKSRRKHHHSDRQAMREILAEVVKIVKESRHPCIWLGHEAQRFQVVKPLLQFAERLRIPIVTSLLGKSAIDEHHPLFAGIYENNFGLPEVRAFVEGCDLIMSFGVALNGLKQEQPAPHLHAEQRITASVKGVMINHHHYQDIYFAEFSNALSQLDVNIRFSADYPACIDRQPVSFTPSEGHPITAERLVASLQCHLPPNALVIAEVGNTLQLSSELVVKQNSFYSPPHFAAPGFSIPATIAAQLIAQHKRVVAIVDHKAFQTMATELATALQYAADPIIIILNYSDQSPYSHYKNRWMSWNYSYLRELLGGGVGERVREEAGLDEALRWALHHRGEFHLLEVEVDLSSAEDNWTESSLPLVSEFFS